MAHEEMHRTHYGNNDSDNFFEIEFESTRKQKSEEDEKQRIRQELLSLEW